MKRWETCLLALALAACAGVQEANDDLTIDPHRADTGAIDDAHVVRDPADAVVAPVGGIDVSAAFARLKTLAGRWSAQTLGGGDAAGAGVPIEYLVTSGGHAVQEKLFAGTDEEMMTIYYLDGRDLALAHYCAMGNRPHMRLDRMHSTPDDLRFEWDGTATDIDPQKDAHIHGGRIHFVDDQTIESEWEFWSGGRMAGVHGFSMSRTADRFTPAGPPHPTTAK